MDTQAIGPFLGINHMIPDFARATEKGYWLRDAVNVDIDNAGWVASRPVPLLVQAMSDAHSLHMATDTTGYLVRGVTILAVTMTPTYSESVFKVLNSGAPVSWVEYNDVLYYSSTTDSGKIIADVWYPMAMPTPDAPTCEAIAGTQYAGKYQVAVSYTNSTTQEESGLSASTEVVLSSDGGIRVTLPASTLGATHINVYVSPINDPIPRFISSHVVGTASVDFAAIPTYLREGVARFEEPLPLGRRLFMFNGQLCSVYSRNLFYGIPFKPGYCLQSDKRIPFTHTVDIAVGNQNGVYVVAGNTYFLAGKQLGAEMEVREIRRYGAVPGTEFVLESASQAQHPVGWFSDLGLIIAGTDGDTTEVMQPTVSQDPPPSGVSVVTSTEGVDRVVSCGWCVNIGTKAVSQYTNWAVTSASGDYATMADGVYTLSGGSGVDAHIDLGKLSFGGQNLKLLPTCYVDMSSETPLELRVNVPGRQDYRYLTRSSSTDLQVQRIDVGKGLRANWYELSLYNTDSSAFVLASVSFAPEASGRRI